MVLPLDAAHTTGTAAAGLGVDRDGVRGVWSACAGRVEVYPGLSGWVAAGSTIEEGRAAGLALLGETAVGAADATTSTRPTAIIAQSDLLAVGVIRAAEELGIDVPGDLSVLGFDGARIDGRRAVRPHDTGAARG